MLVLVFCEADSYVARPALYLKRKALKAEESDKERREPALVADAVDGTKKMFKEDVVHIRRLLESDYRTVQKLVDLRGWLIGRSIPTTEFYNTFATLPIDTS